TMPIVKEQFNLSSMIEGWFVSSALLGAIIGVACSGELSDRFGRKKVLFLSGILFLTSAIGCMIASDFTMLVVFRIIGGVGVGVASNVAPLYISEIAPANIRGALVTCYQLAITFGILLAYLSNAWLLDLAASFSTDSFLTYVIAEESWRSMFGMETLPALLFTTGLLFVPESPRWLYEYRAKDEARRVLEKLLPPSSAAEELRSMAQNAETRSEERRVGKECRHG